MADVEIRYLCPKVYANRNGKNIMTTKESYDKITNIGTAIP